MLKFLRTSSLCLLSALVFAPLAQANDEAHQLIFEPEYINGKSDVGNFNNFYQHDDGGDPIFNHAVEAKIRGAQLTAKITNPKNGEPALLVRGKYWTGAAEIIDHTRIGNAETSTVALDGTYLWKSRFSNAILDFDLDYKERGMRLEFGKSSALSDASSNFTSTVFAERLKQNWRLETIHTFDSVTPHPFNGRTADAWIDETLTTYRAGVSIEGEVKNPLFGKVDLYAGGALDLFAQYSRLTGSECTPSFFGPCDGRHHPRSATATPVYSQANDEDWTVGARLHLDAGFDIKINETVSMRIGGYADVLLNAPEIRNPVFTDPAPASIEHFNSLSHGLKFNFAMKF